MPNLSALSSNMTKAVALSNLVLVSPQSTVGYQPQNPPNPDGSPSTAAQPPNFVFNYEGEQVATLESDITDHFVESNQAIQDQIALKPEVFTTRGFIGELTDIAPPLLAPIKEAADRLTTIGAFEPALSATALIVYSQAFQAYQVAANLANTAVSAWSSVNNFISGSDGQSVIGSGGIVVAGAQNKQQTAFQQFYGYWRRRTLFSIQTPWAVFENMAIKSLRAIQDAETNVITDFEITFKMIRTARSISQPGGIDISYSGRLNSQSASETDLGTSKGTPGPSLSDGIDGMGAVA